MIKTKFMIAVKGEDGQPTALEVEGYRPTADSFLGIHRPEGGESYSVTLLSCGSSVNSIFPAQLRKPSCRKLLLEFIAELEAAEPAAWIVMSAAPWGHAQPPLEWMRDAITIIRARARNL